MSEGERRYSYLLDHGLSNERNPLETLGKLKIALVVDLNAL